MNETIIKTTIEYYEDMKAATQAVVDAYNTHKGGEEIDKLKEAAKEALANYNNAATGDFYKECMEQENPIQYFIKTRYIPNLVKVNYRKSTKTGEWKYTKSDSLVKADIVSFATHNDHNFDMFPSKRTWWYATQKVSLLMANAYNKALADNNPKFAYEVDETAKMFITEGVISEEADITSQKTLTKAVQFIFDNITEGVKAEGKDVKYINDLMVKKGKKACQVVFQNPEEMAELIIDALYHHLTDTSYEVLSTNK